MGLIALPEYPIVGHSVYRVKDRDDLAIVRVTDKRARYDFVDKVAALVKARLLVGYEIMPQQGFEARVSTLVTHVMFPGGERPFFVAQDPVHQEIIRARRLEVYQTIDEAAAHLPIRMR